MELLTINSIGFKGINSDVSPWELPSEFITSGINFRSSSNRIISSGSIDDWDAPAANINAGHIIPVRTPIGNFWIVLGRAKVEVFDGALWHNITSAAGYGGIGVNDELLWTSCMLGAIPIVNNPQHVPEVWDPQTAVTILTPLLFDGAPTTWATKGYSFDVIRSHKNFLFALNLTEGGINFPNAYRWSHPADINGLPFTWDETDLSALAGRAQLGGDGGQLLDGLSLRDSFCMYSESAINILDPSGDEFVWKRRNLSETVGIASKNCVAEIKGTHLFIGDGDILINDGNQIQSKIHNRLRRRFTSQLNGDYYHRSYVVRNTALKEVWFCVAEGSAQYPNTAYVFNWKDDSWSIHDLPYADDGASPPLATSAITHAAYGPKSEAALTYLTVPGSYATTLLKYGSNSQTPLSNTVLGVYFEDSGLTVLDPANSTPGVDTDCLIERRDLMLDNSREVKTVTRLYPLTDGLSSITIQFGASMDPGGSINWTNELVFDPTTDRKLDIRKTGVYFAYRIKSITDGSVSVTGIGVEYANSGKR